MANRKVIYTALAGNYDLLKQPEAVHPDYDYVCFSNDIPEDRLGVWRIRPIGYRNREDVRICRYVKMHPHLLLGEYDRCVWLDCNQRLTEEHYARADRLIAAGSVCAMVLHPERDCVYQEAFALSGYLTGDPEKVYRQTQFLLARGFPPRQGLYVTCCVLLAHHDPRVVRFLESWWELCERYSCRDQMGVMYALAEAGLKPDLFFGRDYWALYRFPHAAPLPHYSFFQRGKRFLARHFFLIRLKLLFRKYGIREFDWHRIQLIGMSDCR